MKRARESESAVDLLGIQRNALVLLWENVLCASTTKKRKMSVTFIIAEILGGIYANGRALTSRLWELIIAIVRLNAFLIYFNNRSGEEMRILLERRVRNPEVQLRAANNPFIKNLRVKYYELILRFQRAKRTNFFFSLALSSRPPPCLLLPPPPPPSFFPLNLTDLFFEFTNCLRRRIDRSRKSSACSWKSS